MKAKLLSGSSNSTLNILQRGKSYGSGIPNTHTRIALKCFIHMNHCMYVHICINAKNIYNPLINCVKKHLIAFIKPFPDIEQNARNYVYK